MKGLAKEHMCVAHGRGQLSGEGQQKGARGRVAGRKGKENGGHL